MHRFFLSLHKRFVPQLPASGFLAAKNVMWTRALKQQDSLEKLRLYTAADLDHFSFEVSFYMIVCVSEPLSNPLFCISYL